VYSNAAVAALGDPCIPKIAVPYYNISTAQTWYAVTGSIQIPVTGWSTGDVGNWLAIPLVAATGPASAAAPKLTVTGGDSTAANGTVLHTINNGQVRTLSVTFPVGTPAGTYAIIQFHSVRVDAAGQRPPAGDDYTHLWTLGVFVPASAISASR
jgi:hypothetical protein